MPQDPNRVKHAPMAPQPPMQRTHRRHTPLTAEEVEDARRVEADRKKWDPEYITYEEAHAIAPEVLRGDIGLQRRIRYSQPDWPENRMSASVAFGPLQGGEGQVDISRGAPASEYFYSEGGGE